MKPKRKKKAVKKPKETQAIVVAQPVVSAAPQPLPTMIKRHQLNQAEVTLLKNTIAKGVSDDEFAMFLWVAKKHRLDPMTRQLHAVKRFTQKHHQDDRGIWVGGETMTIQIGIDGYRTLAARNHKDFGGVDEPEFEFATKGDKVPTMARVRVWKKGFEHPSIGVAYWDEYAPANVDDAKAFMWKKMPKHMLAKCAEALALRRAYPDLSDIYTDEEMVQHDQDFSPEGRLIALPDGRSPSGVPVTLEAQNQARSAAYLEDFEKREEEQLAKAKTEAPKTLQTTAKAPEPPKEAPKGVIELHWLGNKEAAYIAGNGLAGLLEAIKAECFVQWLDQSKKWMITLDSIEKLKKLCATNNYKYLEIQDKPEQVPAAIPPQPTPAAGKPAEEKKGKGPVTEHEPSPSAGHEVTVVSGFVERVDVGMTGKNAPVRQVKIGKAWHPCYSQTLHPFLDKAQGKECSLFVDGRKTIVGIKNIGKRQFDSDGRTPIVDVNEERTTTASLFND